MTVDVKILAQPYEAVQMDYDGSSNLIYVGTAVPGTLTSAASWLIKKLTYSGSNLTQVTFPNGVATYTNIWDNRVSLTYS